MNRRDALTLSTFMAATAWVSAADATAAGKAPGHGWTPLLNGKNLDGWTFYQAGVGKDDVHRAISFHDGVTHVLGPQFKGGERPGFGYIATAVEYGNYHLRLEYKWGTQRFWPRTLAKRDNGVLYHMEPDRDLIFPDCVEFQIQETDVGDAVLVNVQGIEGISLAGRAAWPANPSGAPREYPQQQGSFNRQWFRKTGNFEKLDDWNTIELIAFDDQAVHIVNGRIVTSVYGLRRHDASAANAFKPLTKGRIALEIEGAETLFRNVEIRQLSPEDIQLMREEVG